MARGYFKSEIVGLVCRPLSKKSKIVQTEKECQIYQNKRKF